MCPDGSVIHPQVIFACLQACGTLGWYSLDPSDQLVVFVDHTLDGLHEHEQQVILHGVHMAWWCTEIQRDRGLAALVKTHAEGWTVGAAANAITVATVDIGMFGRSTLSPLDRLRITHDELWIQGPGLATSELPESALPALLEAVASGGYAAIDMDLVRDHERRKVAAIRAVWARRTRLARCVAPLRLWWVAPLWEEPLFRALGLWTLGGDPPGLLRLGLDASPLAFWCGLVGWSVLTFGALHASFKVIDDSIRSRFDRRGREASDVALVFVERALVGAGLSVIYLATFGIWAWIDVATAPWVALGASTVAHLAWNRGGRADSGGVG